MGARKQIKYTLDDAYSGALQELQVLQQELLTLEHASTDILQGVDSRHHQSARNLIHYLGLRRKDIRPLQQSLAQLGLSSLGRTESHVLASLNAMIVLLRRALTHATDAETNEADATMPDGKALLEENTTLLLGKLPLHRRVRILVTLSGEEAHDYPLVKKMLNQGMDCARINCAHDNQETWLRMIENIRLAQRETGKSCRILMDIGGPKLRTGQIALGPMVLKWRPKRDLYGYVLTPARIWVYPENDHSIRPAAAGECLPVSAEWLKKAAVHDWIEFTDTRGSLRSMQLVGQVGDGFWAESNQTAYLRPGIELHLLRASVSGKPRKMDGVGMVGNLPQTAQQIRLERGDSLILTSAQTPGQAAQYDAKGRLLKPATIPCTFPEVFSAVKHGERILFDDGRIGGVIQKANSSEMLVEITQARDGGEKLLSDKGINLPDTRFEMAGLTPQDISHLPFIVQHADMVGLSFARTAADVAALQAQLKQLNAEQFGIVLKIENRAAFEHLPELLFTLLKSPVVGVMIARGDLAIECGYERLAELQEEILWLAEAAHLPVIWATQVLEGLAKTGKPSRAEITDAAMGERSECVMLNKGPHIIQAIQTLNDILQRMQEHQMKKSALLRCLHW